jgi:hypothetical protein
VLDEIENIWLWNVLAGTAHVGFLLPTAVATLKVVLLIAAFVGIVGAIVRAHNASTGERPRELPDRSPTPDSPKTGRAIDETSREEQGSLRRGSG